MDPPLIYLNNAATSWPKPPEVIAAVNESFRTPFSEAGRSATSLSSDCVAEAREIVAQYFHAPTPDHLVFSANATDALNILIHGFAQQQKEKFHVVITELDHNSVIRPLRTLEKEGRCHVTVVPCTGTHIDPSSVADALRSDTRLVVMANGSNVLGSVQDITAIGKILREREIFYVVDGAQTAGLVQVDLGRLPVDAFVFTGHKYLFGLPGTGGFYLHEPERIAATREGGTGTDSGSPFQPSTVPEKFEDRNPQLYRSHLARSGIAFLEKTGQKRLPGVLRDQNALFLGAFAQQVHWRCITLHRAPVISFNMRHMENDDAGFVLRNMYGIVTRTGLHCAPLIHKRLDAGRGCVRLSPSVLTPKADCVFAAACIHEVAEHAH